MTVTIDLNVHCCLQLEIKALHQRPGMAKPQSSPQSARAAMAEECLLKMSAQPLRLNMDQVYLLHTLYSCTVHG